jgi:hypothetical protein
MAKYRKGKKLQPAPTRLAFVLPSDTVNGYHYIDLSQVASIVNRRAYRQGINWAVAGITVVSGGTTSGAVTNIMKLPNTWVCSGAWEKSMRAWLRQQNEALANLDNVEPAKYRDFKVYFDANHATAGIGANLIPWAEGGQFLPGEWQQSTIVVPNDGAVGVTSEYSLHMTGTDTPTSKAMIKAYANSRNTPHSPDPVAPTPLNNSYFNTMFDVGDNNDEVILNATDKNDDLPYDRDDYPGETANGYGGELVYSLVFTTTTIGAKQHSIGATFPCGLIKLQMSGYVGSTNVYVDLVPGDHRGYLCEPMTEM